MSKQALEELRLKIDDIDLKLLKLLNERAALALGIGKLKVNEGLDIHDRSREEALLKDLARHNEGPLTNKQVGEIFEAIIAVSRRIQFMESGPDRRPQERRFDEPLSITGQTALYGILGNPVGHSMSPLMHNTAFRLLGLDAIYLPFEVQDLPAALTGLKALNIKGASVTHPFKEQIMERIHDIDDTAKKIGAVNTLVFEKGSARGTNTDWIGAVRCLEGLLLIQGHTFVVLGTGGAARAVLFGVTSKGGQAIVVGRSEEKGRALAQEFDAAFVHFSEIDSVGGDCLVNTTPVGMYPKEHEMPVPKEVLKAYAAVADVIYNPLQTMLLKEAEAAGCRVASGFDMFIYQGVEQFVLWTRKKAPVEEMRTVVYERLSMK